MKDGSVYEIDSRFGTHTGRHMTKNLSSINAYPIESGMRKHIAIVLNVSKKYQMK